MNARLLAIASMVVLASGSFAAEGPNFARSLSTASCVSWLEFRAANNQTDAAVDGQVYGALAALDTISLTIAKEKIPLFPEPKIAGPFVDKYCRDNPSRTVRAAVAQLRAKVRAQSTDAAVPVNAN